MKRSLVAVFLIAFAVWPAAHAVLASRYGIDPWKLAGFAMYSVPGPMKTVRVAKISRDGSFEVLDYRRYDDTQQAIVDELRERRRALGTLHSLEGAAKALLGTHPDWEGVYIGVASLELDHETAKLRGHEVAETFWRDGRNAPFEFPERD